MPTEAGYTSWVDLDSKKLQAAITMGFNQETWDNEEYSEYADLAWEDLPREIQLAVMVLGDDIDDNAG